MYTRLCDVHSSPSFGTEVSCKGRAIAAVMQQQTLLMSPFTAERMAYEPFAVGERGTPPWATQCYFGFSATSIQTQPPPDKAVVSIMKRNHARNETKSLTGH